MKIVKLKDEIMIFADKGKILTDGEVYADAFSLAKDRTSGEYFEISQEEYDRILRDQELDMHLL